ncbi:SDR family oxidoreductase [Nakamurella sp. YIM 132087]|uniref:SDR family oxidoreductase n=1 Tax=Nakamurella alba TaxID=2665158 RepID=A0A7K1FM27_9ACTN|nr:SDR family oxidoreductase [Nakamurella alba]MTD15212.1 SDR family oxidoreductase [Nakamurella alba]
MSAPKVAVITGAAGGIGAATARALAKDGWDLALVDRSTDALDGLTAELPGARAFGCDIRDPAAVAATAAGIIAGGGPLGALVTCAGVGDVVPLAGTGDELWSDTIAVNLSGTFYWCREVLPELQRQGGGVVVTVASTTALMGLPGRAAYAASKAGVIGLARTLAIEFAGDGIRVVPVTPGATLTPLVRQGYQHAEDPAAAEAAHARLQPIGRLSRPEEIADTIAFVCSPRAATITGAPLVVDGGYSSGGVSWNS